MSVENLVQQLNRLREELRVAQSVPFFDGDAVRCIDSIKIEIQRVEKALYWLGPVGSGPQQPFASATGSNQPSWGNVSLGVTGATMYPLYGATAMYMRPPTDWRERVYEEATARGLGLLSIDASPGPVVGSYTITGQVPVSKAELDAFVAAVTEAIPLGLDVKFVFPEYDEQTADELAHEFNTLVSEVLGPRGPELEERPGGPPGHFVPNPVVLEPRAELLAVPCDHGVKFDPEDADSLSVEEIRELYPRLAGRCPKGCGFEGIAYASKEHFVYGDW